MHFQVFCNTRIQRRVLSQFAVFLNRQAAVPILRQLRFPIISSFASHAVLPLFRFVEEHTTLSDSNPDGPHWAHTDQLHKMVKSILQHWDGILGFWRFGNMTNASMEGFNNKVRTMLRQAYGYRDLEYMRLKIFNLPNNNIKIVI